MLNFITNILGWFVKNVGLIVEILEALLKLAGGIVSLTPSKNDDRIVGIIEDKFDVIKKILYQAADFFGKLGK